MKDITTYEDVLYLITRFYEKLLLDEQIGHFFQELNLNTHIPRVADFWAFILIDQPGYTGNMMDAHARLALKDADFDQWLLLFHHTIDDHFYGEKAALAKDRSTLIAWTMKSKIS
jgi:hemoglobin